MILNNKITNRIEETLVLYVNRHFQTKVFSRKKYTQHKTDTQEGYY